MTRLVRGMTAAGWVIAILIAAPARAGDTDWPDLSSPPSRTGGGENDAAVIVGVENYLFLPDIPGALTNVEDWYLYLTRTLAVPPARITLLRNEEATVEKMRKYAERAASEVDPGGTLWFVFVGHGAASSDGADGVLIGADAQREADSVYARSLPRSELLATLDGGAQERSVVVLDACFSGRSAGGEELVEGLQAYVPHRAARLGGDLAVLAAGRSDQFAGPLPGQVRPAFSYLVLGAMRGWGDADGNGSVTADEAVGYARDALATLVTDRDQTPELSGELGSTVLGLGRERGPDLAAMVLSRGGGGDIAVGDVRIDTGSSVDLRRKAAEAERLRQEREELQRREAELQRQLEEERQRRRVSAESTLLDAAEEDWLALAPLLRSPAPESAEVVELFVDKYGEASVTVDGETTPVEVAQVADARDWLRRNQDAIEAARAGLPEERFDPSNGTGDGTVRRPARVDITVDPRRRRAPAVVMLAAGGATAAAGFILNGSMYQRGTQETDQAMYEWEQGMTDAGLGIGIAGAAVCGTGLIVLIATSAGQRTAERVQWSPGPVSTVSVRF